MSENFDFMALGQAIKRARETRQMTREQLAEILNIAPRHIQSIENEGQHPSLQLFVRLITMFDISADQYIFSNRRAEKTTLRRQVDSILDTLSDRELTIIEETAKAISCSIFKVQVSAGVPYTSKYGQFFRSIHSPTKKFKKCRLQISRNRHSPQILNFEMLSAICMRMYCFRSSSKRPYK